MGILIAVFGPALIPFVIVQAVFGFSLLEAVNYPSTMAFCGNRIRAAATSGAPPRTAGTPTTW